MEKITYGLMWYKPNKVKHTDNINEYQLLVTSVTIQIISRSLEEQIINSHKNKLKNAFLIFRCVGSDSIDMSYADIVTSKCWWAKFIIKLRGKLMYKVMGHNFLVTDVLNNMKLLKIYSKFLDKILRAETWDISITFYDTFGKKSPFWFFKRSRMIKKLLAYKKDEICRLKYIG